MKAVRETTLDMVEAGLFHLRFPQVWVEDVFFESDMLDRYGYFLREYLDRITIRQFGRYRGGVLAIIGGNRWKLMAGEAIIPLAQPTDDLSVDLDGRVEIVRATDLLVKHDMGYGAVERTADNFLINNLGVVLCRAHRYTLGEAVYALKKFIVTLNVKGTIHEQVDPRVRRRDHPKPVERPYPFTINRVPTDAVPVDGETPLGGGRTGAPLRKHLVREYV